MAVSISLVALQVGDMPIFMIAAALASATLGFLVWNFPLRAGFPRRRRRVFPRLHAGRTGRAAGGAQSVGLAVLRAGGAVHPVFETGFSIWRRRFKRGVPVDQPDALHLHQLVFRRLVRVTFSRGRRHAVPALCNALASPYMWVLALIGLVPATIWWDNAWFLCASLVVFAAVYTWLYMRLVSWRRPAGCCCRPSFERTDPSCLRARAGA